MTRLRRSAYASALALALTVAPSLRAQSATTGYAVLDSLSPPKALAVLVSLRASNMTLRSAIANVALQANVGIVFDPALTGLDRTVTATIDRATAARALLRLLEGSGIQAMVTTSGSIVLTPRSGARDEAKSFVTGMIRQESGPLGGVHLWLGGTRFETMSDAGGRFNFGRVPTGSYLLHALRMGFAPIVRMLRVGGDASVVPIELSMTPAAVPVAAVIVTPGYFGVMQPTLASGQTLSRQQIETVPQLGEDVYRTIGRLPGVAADDYSAKFSIRGESADQLFVTLDGLPLIEPYHLKDIGSALSIIDLASLGRAELIAGGPSAEYGDQLAGVFKLYTVEPRQDRVRTSTGISLTNLRAMSQGGFAGGKGSWLVSGRRGFLDLAFKVANIEDSISPSYNDLFAKVEYTLPGAGRVAAHVLHAGDQLKYLATTEPSLTTRYNSDYVWATLDGRVGSALRHEGVVWVGALDQRRDATQSPVARQTTATVDIKDVRAMHTVGMREDWSAELGRRALFKVGADLRHETASYDYLQLHKRDEPSGGVVVTRTDFDTVTLHPSTDRVGLYVSQRVRPIDAFTFEAGVRYDRVSHTGDEIVSPRFNASWQPTGTTTVRGSWGDHSQSEPLYGLQVEDGVRTFQPAERSRQRGIGIDQILWNGLAVRGEAYARDISDLRSKYVNASSRVTPLAEIEEDLTFIAPTRARSRGVEMTIDRGGGRRVDWSVSYVISSSTEELNGRWRPRPTDQPRAIRGDWSYHPENNSWRMSVSAMRHTGWPYTPDRIKVDTILNGGNPFTWLTRVPGELYAGRVNPYQRIDARWTRFIDTKSGRVSLFVDVYNLLNNSNQRDQFTGILRHTAMSATYTSDARINLPRIPSFGINWEF